MTAPATYTFVIGNNAEQAAKAAHAARYTQDDWRINAEGTVTRARVRGQVVWAVRYLKGQTPTLYITFEQATKLGICAYDFCGKPAEYAGFEGVRCGQHSKFGMSMLCTTVGCTSVSEGGFSSYCVAHTTPAMREARERHQATLRARYT